MRDKHRPRQRIIMTYGHGVFKNGFYNSHADQHPLIDFTRGDGSLVLHVNVELIICNRKTCIAMESPPLDSPSSYIFVTNIRDDHFGPTPITYKE